MALLLSAFLAVEEDGLPRRRPRKSFARPNIVAYGRPDPNRRYHEGSSRRGPGCSFATPAGTAVERSRVSRRRWLTGTVFAAVTVTACVLVGQRLTGSSWPLAHARAVYVVSAAVCYFASFILRARGLHRLFPREQQPDQARCLASVGAAAASGAVLPFRLDYLIKIGTLRRLRGVRIGLEAIALSIVSLGMVDAVAMLPLSISATATSSASFRGPLLIVVFFGLGCTGLLIAGAHLVRLPLLRRSR